MPRAPHSGMFLQHGAAEPSREEPSSPARAPGVRQLTDTFHLDVRVHKQKRIGPAANSKECFAFFLGDLQYFGVISYNVKNPASTAFHKSIQ